MTSEPTNPSSANNPDAAFIDFDLSCVRCGYNLRGRPRNGRCSECGQPAGLSLAGRYLVNAELGWLRLVYKGIMLRVCLFPALASSMIIPEYPFFTIPVRIAMFAAISLLATCFLTCRDSAEPFSKSAGRSRWFTRCLALVTALFTVITILMNAGYFVTIGAISLSIVADIMYLRRIAERVPDPNLAAASESLGIAFGICLGVLGLCAVLFGLVALVTTGRSFLGEFFQFAGVMILGAVPLAGIFGFLLLCKYAVVIHRQVWMARRRHM